MKTKTRWWGIFCLTLLWLGSGNIRATTFLQLNQTNDQTYGLSFDWGRESTFVLQGSADLTNWTNISYIWSTPPETSWTTNQPLNDFGNFFRVAFVSGEYTTDLPPLNSSSLRSKTSITAKQARPTIPRVTRCNVSNGEIAVSLVLSPNQPCELRAKDSHGITKQTKRINSPQDSATIRFNTSDLPNPVFFDAIAAP